MTTETGVKFEDIFVTTEGQELSASFFVKMGNKWESAIVAQCEAAQASGDKELELEFSVPIELAQHPAIIGSLSFLTLQAKAAKRSSENARTRGKADKLIALLDDPDIVARMEAKFGPQRTVNARRVITEAMGESPNISNVEIAMVVVAVLRKHNLPTNSSKDGLVVKCLEGIRRVTGFATNSEHSARIACALPAEALSE